MSGALIWLMVRHTGLFSFDFSFFLLTERWAWAWLTRIAINTTLYLLSAPP
jgi:hypothetical protein